MPRFYFDLFDNGGYHDPEGRELPSVEAAMLTASKEAREIACAEVSEGYLNLDHRIEIRNSVGERVAAVRFREAVRLQGGEFLAA